MLIMYYIFYKIINYIKFNEKIIFMNLSDLAEIMGKSINEVKEILKEEDVVQVKLNERSKSIRESGNIEVI